MIASGIGSDRIESTLTGGHEYVVGWVRWLVSGRDYDNAAVDAAYGIA